MNPQIEGQEVTEQDIARAVTYVPNHAKDDATQWENGWLSSYRDDGGIWIRFKGPNGEKCDADNLRWGHKKQK
jgi:hypothetical protein